MEVRDGVPVVANVAAREEELERFREAWKQEVEQKRTWASMVPHTHGQQLAPGFSPDHALAGPSTSSAHLDISPPKEPVKVLSTNTLHSSGTPALASTSRAVDLYRAAVECEQQGHLDEALALYRRSFKLDSNVDRAYHRAVSLESPPMHSPRSLGSETASKIVELPVAERGNRTTRSAPPLQQILSTLEPRPVIFGSEDERLPNPFETLPDEVILHILMLLASQKDIMTIERFATVNLKARLLTTDGSIWRSICEHTYVPPQLPQGRSAHDVATLYGLNYRHTFVNHPRVRLDGCYIAVCHYIRPGQSENAWVAIRHLITYHRLLRFFPDGTVVSLLINEEKPLAEMVHQLKPSIRVKGSQFGTWALEDGTRRVRIRNLRAPEPGGSSVLKYEFAMDLTLTSARRGSWNKMEMDVYASVNIATSELQELPIKRERPFYFSKVRSYAT